MYCIIFLCDTNLSHKTRLKKFDPDFVMALGRGGLMPAVMLGCLMRKEVSMLNISFYKDGAKPEKKYAEPKLVSPLRTDVDGKRLVLVDDFVRTGASLKKAQDVLKEKGAEEVRTVIVAGGDGALIEVSGCVKFPWGGGE